MTTRNEASSARPVLSKRGYTLRLGLWSLGVGAVPLLAGLFWGLSPLIQLGSIVALTGVIWLVVSPFAGDEPMSRAYRRHQNEMIVIMAGYVLGVFAFVYANDLGLPTWARALSALLPVLPTVLVVRSLWRYVRDSDELERRIQMEAIILASSVTMVLTFLAGWLEFAHVWQFDNGLVWVLPLMAFSYSAAVGWRRRKYGIDDWC